jgi:hypothetical protein
VDIASDGVGVSGGEGAFMLEVDIVVVDELGGKCDQGDVAGQSAIVEPVDADRRDAIDLAG